MMTPKQRKIILLIGGTIFALLIVMVLFNTVPKIGKAELDIVVAPSEATFTIDGQKASSGKNYVTPGEHTLTVSLAPFEDVTKKVNTKDLKAGEQIFMYPKIDASTEAARKWFQDHPKAGDELNALGAKENAVVTARINKDLPLVKDLPHESSTFIIGYSLNEDNTEISYQVTLLPYLLTNRPGYKEQLLEYKAQAETWLKNRGVDIATAKITYTPDPASVK
jgi:hypothetical protein